MLRKSRAFPLALYCALFVAILEALDIVIEKNQGIPVGQSYYVNQLRYLPPAGIVSLGFAWKCLVGDMKAIAPWSAMSGRWATASEALFLNYVNQVEITAAYMAIKRKHWTMAMVLINGFLIGVSVAFANILTYVEPFSTATKETRLERTSSFNLNGTLVSPDGKILTPLDHLGSQPYGVVAAQRLPGGHYGPWTLDQYAFDSFTIASDVTLTNASLEAKVSAFSVIFTCEKNACASPFHDSDVLVEQPLDRQAVQGIRQTAAWLDVISCPEGSRRTWISANLATIASGAKVFTTERRLGSGRVLSLMCTPEFAIQEAQVRVDTLSGNIMSYSILSGPMTVDVPISMEAICISLNNPTDARVQGDLKNTATMFADLETVRHTSRWLFKDDPFFDLLMSGAPYTDAGIYLNDTGIFKTDFEDLAGKIILQVVSSFGRSRESQHISGSIITTGPRMFIRKYPLRGLQATLLLAFISCVLIATRLRPRTLLVEDPGTLAATAIILAATDTETEAIFAHHSISSDHSMLKALSQTRFRLSRSRNDSMTHLEMDAHSHTSPALTVCSDRRGIQNNPEIHAGWKPLSLKPWAKWATVILSCAVIAALAVLQILSNRRNGLGNNITTSQTVLGYVISIILLVMSYVWSGIDSAVKSMNSYNSVRGSPRRQSLLLNNRDAPKLCIPCGATGIRSGFAVVASSVVLLLFPIVKIIAAGLYTNLESKTITTSAQLEIDTSLIAKMENFDFDFDLRAACERASQFTEWTVTPTFNILQRASIVDHLVLSNFTGLERAQTIRYPLGEKS